MNTKKAIGSRIKQLRKDARITQERLAELSNITAKHLGSIECGNENPTIDTLERISQSLNVELSELLDIGSELSRKETQAKILNIMKTSDDDQLRLVLTFITMLKKQK